MFIITEHQVLTSYFEQKLAKKYQYERPQIQKYHKGCLDTFCYYGKELDLSTAKNRQQLLQFTLHYQSIIDRYIKFLKNNKNDKAIAIEKGFPNPDKVFYSDQVKEHRNLVFVQPINLG